METEQQTNSQLVARFEEDRLHAVRRKSCPKASAPACGKYFADTFSSFDSPATFCLYKGDGTFISELGRTVFKEEYQTLGLIPPEHFVFKSGDGYQQALAQFGFLVVNIDNRGLQKEIIQIFYRFFQALEPGSQSP